MLDVPSMEGLGLCIGETELLRRESGLKQETNEKTRQVLDEKFAPNADVLYVVVRAPVVPARLPRTVWPHDFGMAAANSLLCCFSSGQEFPCRMGQDSSLSAGEVACVSTSARVEGESIADSAIAEAVALNLECKEERRVLRRDLELSTLAGTDSLEPR